jgi:pantoate--beta-alanine ligase
VSIRLITNPSELNDVQGQAFVPTMGALHAGHCSLIQAAAASGLPVLVSIFVNPAQFAPEEDFDCYPRALDTDLQAAEAAGAATVFAPNVATIYPADEPVWDPPLPEVATRPHLEDAHRPHFFGGVCRAVARLLDLLQPASLMLGEKDYQQLLVLSDLVADHARRWPRLQVHSGPTVREPNGLAMSSRNAHLDTDQGRRATGLIEALRSAAQQPDIETAESCMQAVLEQHRLQVDYAVVRDAATLGHVTGPPQGHRALIAARLDGHRLIDNMAC